MDTIAKTLIKLEELEYYIAKRSSVEDEYAYKFNTLVKELSESGFDVIDFKIEESDLKSHLRNYITGERSERRYIEKTKIQGKINSVKKIINLAIQPRIQQKVKTEEERAIGFDLSVKENN